MTNYQAARALMGKGKQRKLPDDAASQRVALGSPSQSLRGDAKAETA